MARTSRQTAKKRRLRNAKNTRIAAPPTNSLVAGTSLQAAKNRRKRDAKNRRTALRRSTILQISTQPNSARTLRKSARVQQHRDDAPHQWINTWTKDPLYRYKPTEHHAASLLGLPTELRQTILGMTVTSAEFELWTWSRLGQWVGALSCVSPLFRVDMMYVQRIWKTEKRAADAKDRLSIGALELPGPGVGVKHSKKKGRQVKARQTQKKVRDQKCWYCERRHFSKDPVCPLARENPSEWVRRTRVDRRRSLVAQDASNIFGGTKITFEG